MFMCGDDEGGACWDVEEGEISGMKKKGLLYINVLVSSL